MRVGILLCGEGEIEEVEKFGTYDSFFEAMLAQTPNLDFKAWSCQKGQYPDSVEDADLWIIPGSKSSCFDDEDWIRNVLQWIRDIDAAGKGLLGVCFGHQAIHHALGGEVNRSPKGWGIGTYPVTIEKDYLGLAEGEQIRLIAVHQDQVENMAEGFERIAGSDFCPNSISTKGARVLTMQYHPEFDEPFYRHLLDRVEEKVGPERYAQGVSDMDTYGVADRPKALSVIDSFVRSLDRD